MSVSVLIPAYNAESFIIETLDSVRTQSVQPIETVILDDGSTDRTVNVISAWSARYHYPVTILKHDANSGIGQTRYDLARHVKTKFATFLSGDDAWCRDFLKEALALANNNIAVFSEYYVCNEKLSPTTIFTVPTLNIRNKIIQCALRKNMFVNFSCVLIPTRIFKTCQFQGSLRYGEDLVFLLDTVIHKLIWRPLHKPLLYYRVHENMGTFKVKKPMYEALWFQIKIQLRRLGISSLKISIFYYYWKLRFNFACAFKDMMK